MKAMSVRHMGKRIVWGIIFLSLQVNLFGLPSPNAWIGWALIGSTIERISELIVEPEIKKKFLHARYSCWSVLLLAILAFFAGFAQGQSHTFDIIGSFAAVFLEMNTFYLIHKAFMECDEEHRNEVIIKRSVYCAALTLVFVVYVISHYVFVRTGLSYLCVFILIIIRLWMGSELYHVCACGGMENLLIHQLYLSITAERAEIEVVEPLWKYCMEKRMDYDIDDAADLMLEKHRYHFAILLFDASMGQKEIVCREFSLVKDGTVSDIVDYHELYIIGENYRWIYYYTKEKTGKSLFIPI